MEKLPLLCDQWDRLAVGDWIQRQGLGEDVRMFGGGFRLRGPLDVEALRSILQVLVHRHDALRAIFPENGLAGFQHIGPPCEIELVERDVSAQPPDERLRAATLMAGAFLSRNVPLDGGLLLRATLIRLADDDHVFGVAGDHLVLDGEAYEILVNELWNRYAAMVGAQPWEAPPHRYTYRDFVRWEEEWLRTDPAPPAAIARMAQVLDGMGVNPPVVLAGNQRDTNAAYTVGVHSGSLDGDVFDLFAAHCRATRTTPFATLLTAFMSALHACGNPPDVGLKVPVTRRLQPHLLDLVCTLATHATTRARIDLAKPLTELARPVRGAVVETLQLGQVPAPAVLAKLAPHMLGRLFERPTAFFDVAAGWSGGHREIGELTVAPAHIPFDLNQIESLDMFVSIADRRIAYVVFYPSDVFTDVGVRDLTAAFETIVRRSLTEPGIALGSTLR